jgi:hypothetical protein
VLERVVATPDPGGTAIAARVVDGCRTAVFLLRPGETESRETRACGALDYQTDARLLHYAEAGHLLTLDLADASHALALRDGWVSVAASEPCRDLHIAIAGGVLDVQASSPPPHLRIQGGALGTVRRVRLNQRELPASPRQPDTVTLYGVDWPTSASHRPEGASFAPLL